MIAWAFFGLVLAVVIGVVALAIELNRGKSSSRESLGYGRPTARPDWLPARLAKLVDTEHKVSGQLGEHVVFGRLDALYEDEDALLVPLEYKARAAARAYPGDVLQLSLYTWLLRRKGKRVAGYGYVVTGPTDCRRAIQVSLYDDRKVEAAIQRHVDLLEGRVEARRASRAKCAGCAQREHCT